MIQQELKPQPTSASDDDELYEEEPRHRSWAAIASVVLALALIFVGYQWRQAIGREQRLVMQVNALRADAETQRLRAEESQRQVEGLQKRVAALAAERETLAERAAALEKAPARATAARPGGRDRATAIAPETPRTRAIPVAGKKPPRP